MCVPIKNMLNIYVRLTRSQGRKLMQPQKAGPHLNIMFLIISYFFVYSIYILGPLYTFKYIL